MDTTDTEASPLRALLHRWFVEYNPTYLFSAALVLAGLTLVSCDVAHEDALAGIGLTGVAELYALALIGGAALLVRLGQRRAGVMVGLLAALYQCDLTMHTETCAFLGELGWALALGWAALFHVKLRLLARALDLRPSRTALAVPSVGALVVALAPHALRSIAAPDRGPVTALAVFAVGIGALWTRRTIESAVGYDYRGRRAIRGTWILFAVGALAHVAYWGLALHVDLLALVPVAILLATRWATRERAVWLASCAALATALVDPALLPVISAMVAVVLALRALRAPDVRAPVATATAGSPAPYRGAPPEPTAETSDENRGPTFAPSAPPAMARLLAGALASVHVSAWTTLAAGGVWRPHVLWLDVLVVLVIAVLAVRLRRAEPVAPIVGLGVHLAITTGWLTMPRAAGEWGAWSIAIGFAVLGGSLAASWWIAREGERETAAG